MNRRPLICVLALVPLFSVASVTAQTNFVIIDGSFGDWLDESTNFDSNDGVNPACDDHPGQGDVKAAGIASNYFTIQPANTIYLRFDFDDVGATGANTFDGCWLMDANGNGTVEQALCFTLDSNPAVLSDTRYFTCADSTVDTCASDTPVPLPPSVMCMVNQITAPDILNDCGDTTDTAVECEIAIADLPVPSSGGPIALMQACSFNSQQPNSNGVDCVIDADHPWTIDPTTGDNGTPTAPVELLTVAIE